VHVLLVVERAGLVAKAAEAGEAPAEVGLLHGRVDDVARGAVHGRLRDANPDVAGRAQRQLLAEHPCQASITHSPQQAVQQRDRERNRPDQTCADEDLKPAVVAAEGLESRVARLARGQSADPVAVAQDGPLGRLGQHAIPDLGEPRGILTKLEISTVPLSQD